MARKPARKSRSRASSIQRVRGATPENPTFNLNSDAAWDALGAVESSSGVSVNQSSALTVSGVWRAVNLLSSSTARLPLYTYKRKGQGKDRATEHPAYYLLRRKPNDRQTAFEWKRIVVAHAALRGNHYSLIIRDEATFAPTALVPLDPSRVTPVLVNGELWYVVSIDMGNGRFESRKLRPFEVLHVRGFGSDGVMGLDLMTYSREALGLAIAHQRYSAVFFKNNARPSVIFMFPSAVAETARREITRSWERMHAGIENAHRTAVLDKAKDVTIKELSITARDSQLIEQEKFDLVNIANLWGVPVHKIGGEGRTAYASLEQENQAFLDEGLDPWLVNIEEECWDKLLTEEEKHSDTHVVEFMRNALVRADLEKRATYYRTGLGGRPWLTQNEVRGMENMNPYDSPEADEILDPLNMGQGGADNEPAKEQPPAKKDEPPKKEEDDDPEARAAVASLLADATRRMVKRLDSQAAKAERDGVWSDFIHGPMRTDNLETLNAAFAPLETLAGVTGLAERLLSIYPAMRNGRAEADAIVAKFLEMKPCSNT